MRDTKMKATTKLSERPINPRTGYPYKEGTKKFNEWFDNLSERDKNVYSDITASI